MIKWKMKQRWKRGMSVILTVAVVLPAVNVTTPYASVDDAVKIITGFDELGEKYAVQTLEVGADESDIKFPRSLKANVMIEKTEESDDGEEETVETVETATPSNAKKVSGDKEEAAETATPSNAKQDVKSHKKERIKEIEWVLNTAESTEWEFDPDIAGIYTYEPVLPDNYEIDGNIAVPQIVVNVEEAAGGTGLVDGVLTLTETKGSDSANGWDWSISSGKLNINAKFSGNSQIVFVDGLGFEPTIIVNRDLTIEPQNGEPAVIAPENLTIAGSGTMTVAGPIKAVKTTISGKIAAKEDGNYELFHLESGETLKLAGGSLSGGSIYLSEGAMVEGMNGKFSDQGKIFEVTGSETVVPENTPAEDNQLSEGNYVYVNGIYTKSREIEGATELVDGVLTVADTVPASGEGWSWDGTVLKIDGTFKNNNQIVFKEGLEIAPEISVTGSVLITPKEGNPVILAPESLAITGTGTLLVRGPIKAN
ncbi:MAG: hypothetical protein ACOX8K_14020, partial [Lachnospiraceae bacterium]